jgi:hypothetical protein
MEYDSTVASVQPIVWCAGCGHLILPFLIVAVGLDRRQNQTFGSDVDGARQSIKAASI